MLGAGRQLFGRAKRQVRDDLGADPYLLYILVGAALLTSFWFWHRIPNFATRDEKSRLLDAMVPYGTTLADPSFESLRAGVEWSRVPFGATLYLFGLAMLPVVLVALLTGQSEIFTAVGFPSWEFGHYPVWHETPRWVWTWSLVFVRLFNVAFAVGSVYLTYRLGTAMGDRTTGRLSAILLTLTFGFLTIAHEGGEDMPALFFSLLTLYLLYVFVKTGDDASFFAASAFGGVAIAFKLTAAPIVAVIAVAYLFRADLVWAYDDERSLPAALFAPRLLVGGAALGLVAILLGFPTFLVAGFDPLIERVFGGSMSRMSHPTGPDAPIWWWFLRGYFSALGLPLFAAALGGVLASVARLRRWRSEVYGTALVLFTLALYLAMFSQWHDFRVHHLLPTFPLIALLLARSLGEFDEWNPSIARPAVALLLVTTSIYAGVGTLGFASMPRDEATAWLNEHSEENDTMEVYRRDFQDAAIPHGMDINHAFGEEGEGERLVRCPRYIQLGYRDLLYLKEGSYYRNGEAQAEYIRGLLEGEYSYEIVAEFGERPPNFVPQRATPGSFVDLLRYGVVPQTDQFADEQELAANQYTVILERTGECSARRNPPF
ncbi:glycosyltransferase family 39 protein [Halomicroarcula limicola]|uniref:Glycosyltransferase family 39 protein n=1 Tax=Haloarcula limicola TaxID=1429915 RepID=A0A8J7Y548_9EURY|nr:glycosyltransferase family 39 protein [Halomicroarcula limicola]MBV0924217.1 glycosyltransferase family 39 protein [Halomicroarcula limicola]